MKKQSQSLNELFMRMFPNLQTVVLSRPSVDPEATKALFSIWQDERQRISENVYRRPVTLSGREVDAMTKAGLARSIGDRIEITNKGAEVIRVMILGDNRSVFEDKGEIIDYERALASAQTPTVKHAGVKQACQYGTPNVDTWWGRFA